MTGTTTYSPANIPGFDNTYINNLLYSSRTRWGTGNGVTTVTYSFPQLWTDYGRTTAEESDLLTFAPITNINLQNIIKTEILSQFESVANLKYTLITESASSHADTPIAYSNRQGNISSVQAWCSAPGQGAAADLWIALALSNQTDFSPGTSLYETLIHELGHSLDLKHSFDVPALPLDHDCYSYTVMSYTEFRNVYYIPRGNVDGDFKPETLMMDDIRALQYIYGPNFNSKSGNTTYQWNPGTGAWTVTDVALNGTTTTQTFTPTQNKIFMTVWDGGGNDTYDFSLYSNGLSVNLQPGEWTTTSNTQLPSYAVAFGPNATPPGSIANAYLYLDPATGLANPSSLIENAIGGSGDDSIIGNQAANNLAGRAGNDKLYGLAGNDTLDGGVGDDYLSGDAGDDTLNGDVGNDSLSGGDGADVLDGGAGDDVMRGGAGDDTYLFSFGSGRDTILQGDGGADRLLFGANVFATSITWTRSGNDLIATLTGGADQVTLKNWYWPGVANQLTFWIGDINHLTQVTPTQVTGAQGVNLTAPPSGGTVNGSDVSETLFGSAQADVLNGGAGNDTLTGGAGTDTLKGGVGDDTYVFNRGDGADAIYDDSGSASTDGGSDALSFGYGISAADLSITMSGTSIIIGVRNPSNPTATFAQLTDKITIQDWATAAHRIETFSFADLTTLNLAGIISRFGTDGIDVIDLSGWTTAVQLNLGAGADKITASAFNDTIDGGDGDDSIIGGDGADLITGGIGNDTLIGGRGDDTLIGGGGDDTYVFGIGDGKDWIYDFYVNSNDVAAGTDTLSFGAGITIGNLVISMTTVGGYVNLIIGVNNSNITNATFAQLTDVISIFDWRTTNHRIETFRFADGSSYTASQLVGYMGTNGNDAITWTESAVTLNGGGGNDTLTGGAYNDSIFGGDGNDSLIGGGGVDTLRGGAGDDVYVYSIGSGKVLILQGDGGVDRLQFTTGIAGSDVSWTRSGDDLIGTVKNSATDKVTIQNYYLSDTYKLQYYFTIVGTDFASTLTGSNWDESISGGVNDDTLYGGGGNDTLDGGIGNDKMYGGLGDDVYYVGITAASLSPLASNIYDIVSEAFNEGIDTVYSYLADYTLTANVENLIIINVLDGGRSGAKGTGNDLNNRLTGSGSSNVLNGMGGDDTLIGAAGNDTLDGGVGDDTAVYSGARSQYVITEQANHSFIIQDTRTSQDGTDTIYNIEHLQFADGVYDVANPSNAPRILRTGADHIDTTREASVRPFANVTIADNNIGVTETVTITVTGSGGTLSAPSLISLGSGVYKLTGSASAVTTALNSLTFTATAGAPGLPTTTNFQLSVVNSAYTTPVTDNLTSVTDTAAAVSPVITGAVSSQRTTGETPIRPFAGVTVTDRNSGATETLTITLSGTGGTLTNPSSTGLTLTQSNGVYSLIGTASEVTAALNQLVFTPSVNSNSATSTTTFTLSDTSSAYSTAVTNSLTSVIDTAVAPTITGTIANQTTTSESPIRPFAGVTVADQNNGATDALTITLTGTGGTLTNPSSTGVTFSQNNNVYTLIGTASDITAALNQLIFTPNSGLPGKTTTTTLTLKDTTSANYLSAYNNTTTVLNTDLAVMITGAEAGQILHSLTPIKPFAGVTLSNATANAPQDLTITLSDGDGGYGGTLSGNGLTALGNGVYKISGRTAGVTTRQLHDLVFTPDPAVAGSKHTTTFTLSDTSAADNHLTVTDNHTSVLYLAPFAEHDFNGDLKSDIVLQRDSDGVCYVWEMNGLSMNPRGADFIAWAPGKEWQVKATGDFDCDGKSDILLQRDTDGACYIWEMDSLTVKPHGADFIAWAPGKEWQVKATGDFDGDGKSDILLQRDSDGACYIWEMDGLTVKPSGADFIAWAPGKEWQVKATGDFDGDGKSDILLQRDSDGACYIWEMDGLKVKQGGADFIAWAPGKEWEVKSIGDYDGDGKSDVLLQRADDGACYIWEMNGLIVKQGGAGFIAWAPGSDWHAMA